LGRKRKAYTPAATLEFEAAIKAAWIEQEGDEPFEGPVGMTVEIGSNHVEVEVHELAESHRPKHVRGDLDNYHKSIQDGLNGVAYRDDRQVHYIDLRFVK
jgi:Holliday junction resolvase RusA-like endonuclease